MIEKRVSRISATYDFRQSWIGKINDEDYCNDSEDEKCNNDQNDNENGPGNTQSSDATAADKEETEFKSLLVASLALETVSSSEGDHERWLEKVKKFHNKLSHEDELPRQSTISPEDESPRETLQTAKNKWRYLAGKVLEKHPRSHILDFLLEVAADGGEFENFNEGGDENVSLRSSGLSSCTLSTIGSGLGDSIHSQSQDFRPQLGHKASIFTVWRPTSTDAIRKMICNEAVGKGVDIKGKSSKKGKLSGFVPFLQINKNHHKQKIKFFKNDNGEKDGQVVRIFFTTLNARQRVVRKMLRKNVRMGSTNVMATVTQIDDYQDKNRFGLEIPIKLFWVVFILMQDITCEKGSIYERGRPSSPLYQDMNLDTICANSSFDLNAFRKKIGAYEYDDSDGEDNEGEEEAEEYGDDDDGYRIEGYDHINDSDRIHEDTTDSSLDLSPKPVLLQNASEDDDPMNPFELLLAYEDEVLGTVLPVVSDFDCFLIGTKRVRYNKPMEDNQLEIVKWNMQQIESILQEIHQAENNDPAQSPRGQQEEEKLRRSTRISCCDHNGSCLSMSFMERWIKYYKMDKERILELGGRNFGYGDPKSRKIIKAAIKRLRLSSGAMRHGPECFNYLMPQDLDDEYLIISESRQQSMASLSSLADFGSSTCSKKGDDYFYQTVNREQLQFFLETKILEGYTFPLHPKWILCDGDSDGGNKWKELYDLLLSSKDENTIDSMNVWFPPDSGIREDIQRIHNKYPEGFM